MVFAHTYCSFWFCGGDWANQSLRNSDSRRIVAEVSLFRSTFLSRTRAAAAAKAKAKAKAAADRDSPVDCRSGRPLRRVKGKRKVAELDDLD